MKKITFLAVSMLLTATMAFAGESFHDDHGKRKGLSTSYRFAQPIKFVERGVEFFIFPNGEMEFNTNRSRSYYGQRDRTYRRNYTRYGRNKSNNELRPRIVYDAWGRVIKVGKTWIDYNRYDQIKRIGLVFVDYDHRGLVNQIGGLKVKYNPAGKLIRSYGSINPRMQYCRTCNMYGCEMDHSNKYHDDHRHDEDWKYKRKRKRK